LLLEYFCDDAAAGERADHVCNGTIGAPLQASYKRWTGDHYLDVIKDCLGDNVFQAAFAERPTMSLSRAILFGLEDATI
jgi:hypothetical protein